MLFILEHLAFAFELLGFTYLDKHHDYQLALQYWRAACDVRDKVGVSKQIQLHCPRNNTDITLEGKSHGG